jgi:hypothetical protein
MAAKQTSLLDEPSPNAEQLIEAALADLRTIVVAWSPASRLVNLLSIKVNTERIALDELSDASPWVAKLPPMNGKLKVTWAIVPKVPVLRVVIAVTNMRTGKRAIVDISAASGLARNQLWENNKGIIINAP